MEEYIITMILSGFVGLLLYILKERGKTIKDNAKHIRELEIRMSAIEREVEDIKKTTG